MTQAISIIRTDDNSKLHFLDAWHLTLGLINVAAGKGAEELPSVTGKGMNTFGNFIITKGGASNSKNSSVFINGTVCNAPVGLTRTIEKMVLDAKAKAGMENNSNTKPSVHSDSHLGEKKHPSILKPDDVTNITRSDTSGMIYTTNKTSVNNESKKCPACVNGGLETCPTPVSLMRGQLMEVKETKMEDNSNSNLPATSDIEYGANEDESNDESESSDCCTTLSNDDGDHCDDSTTIIHSENGSQETTSVQEMTSNSNKEGNDGKEAATIEFKEPSNRSIKPSIKGQDKKMRKDKMSNDTMNALKRYLIERTLKFVKETCRTAVKKSW